MTSRDFKVTNGVRQGGGGILSPYLFNIYMDDPSLILMTKYAGCKIANKIINHLFYADLVLMCPSFRSLQDLLDTCASYADNLDIKFNTSKCHMIKHTGEEPYQCIQRDKAFHSKFIF